MSWHFSSKSWSIICILFAYSRHKYEWRTHDTTSFFRYWQTSFSSITMLTISKVQIYFISTVQHQQMDRFHSQSYQWTSTEIFAFRFSWKRTQTNWYTIGRWNNYSHRVSSCCYWYSPIRIREPYLVLDRTKIEIIFVYKQFCEYL
jgi:hypothetical protein